MVRARRILIDAVSTANAISDDGARSSALSSISNALAEIGAWSEALDAANALPLPGARSRALSAVAFSQARAGRLTASRQTLALATIEADRVRGEWGRSRALFGIARAQAAAGSVEEARNTFEMAINTAYRIDFDLWGPETTLTDIVNAQAEVGLWDDALDTANALTDDVSRSLAYYYIARAQTDAALVAMSPD